MPATKEKAPIKAVAAAPGAEDPNTNYHEGEQIMVQSTNPITETVERYTADGNKVRDYKEDRFARFIHPGTAQLAADWLNSPSGDPDAYEWHGMLMVHDALVIAEQMQAVARSAGWDLTVPDLAVMLAEAEPYVAEVTK